MGSASSGRFSTDRSVRPDYDRRPSEQTRARWAACRDAQLVRYLRSQNVVGLVVAGARARKALEDGGVRHDELQAAIGVAHAMEDAVREARLQGELASLRERMAAELRARRQVSQQLRLIGISPKQEALLRKSIPCRLSATLNATEESLGIA